MSAIFHEALTPPLPLWYKDLVDVTGWKTTVIRSPSPPLPSASVESGPSVAGSHE